MPGLLALDDRLAGLPTREVCRTVCGAGVWRTWTMAACLRCCAVHRCGACATATAFVGPDVRVCSLAQVLKHLTPLPDLFLAARVCRVRAF